MHTHLNQIHKWVNQTWHLVWVEHLSSSFLQGFGTMRPIGLWRLIVFGLTVLHLLTFNIIWSTNSLRRAIGSARADQLRRADTQIKSHRSIKSVIYDPLPTFSLFSSLSLPLSFFTSAHNILTKSFFDGGISHDSRKMAARRGRERNREGQNARRPRWKLKNSSSSFILSDVRTENAKRRKFHTRPFSTHSANYIR